MRRRGARGDAAVGFSRRRRVFGAPPGRFDHQVLLAPIARTRTQNSRPKQGGLPEPDDKGTPRPANAKAKTDLTHLTAYGTTGTSDRLALGIPLATGAQFLLGYRLAGTKNGLLMSSIPGVGRL